MHADIAHIAHRLNKEGIDIDVQVEVSTLHVIDLSMNAESTQGLTQAMKQSAAQQIRDRILSMSDDELWDNLQSQGVAVIGLSEQASGADVESLLSQACEQAGVALSEAPEPEIEGLWDWRQNTTGAACEYSFDSKIEAMANAVRVLDLDIPIPDSQRPMPAPRG